MDVDHVECQHCKHTGTCTNGLDGQSCLRCIAFWTKHKEFVSESGKPIGLVCSVCWGKGSAELSSVKWNYRTPAYLAFVIVLFGFLILFVFGWRHSEQFDKLLVFVSTLIGSITGYYFAAKATAARTATATSVEKAITREAARLGATREGAPGNQPSDFT
jgi:hypothetical protein